MEGGSRGADHVSCICQLCFRDFYARESVMDRFVHLGIAYGQDATRTCALLMLSCSATLSVHTTSTKPRVLIQNALDGSRVNATVCCFFKCHLVSLHTSIAVLR